MLMIKVRCATKSPDNLTWPRASSSRLSGFMSLHGWWIRNVFKHCNGWMIGSVREDWEESFLVDWWKPNKVEYIYCLGGRKIGPWTTLERECLWWWSWKQATYEWILIYEWSLWPRQSQPCRTASPPLTMCPSSSATSSCRLEMKKVKTPPIFIAN